MKKILTLILIILGLMTSFGQDYEVFYKSTKPYGICILDATTQNGSLRIFIGNTKDTNIESMTFVFQKDKRFYIFDYDKKIVSNDIKVINFDDDKILENMQLVKIAIKRNNEIKIFAIGDNFDKIIMPDKLAEPFR